MDPVWGKMSTVNFKLFKFVKPPLEDSLLDALLDSLFSVI